MIRPITDLPTLRAVEDLQQQIWSMPDREIVPYYQLLAATSAGGVVLGAFAAEKLVGFCYGFVGLRDGGPIFYSHMAGVVDGWRGAGVGFLLKQAQREAALARGLERMVWTFDPLRAANAYFNLRKLGAEARRYYVNYYGAMGDKLNRRIESDRLEVDWHLHSPRVATAMGDPETTGAGDAGREPEVAGALAPLALAASGDPPRPSDEALPDAPIVRLAVPNDFGRLRSHDVGLSRAWREATRRVFLAYFDRGYVAADFHRAAPAGFYVLRRDVDGTGHAS